MGFRDAMNACINRLGQLLTTNLPPDEVSPVIDVGSSKGRHKRGRQRIPSPTGHVAPHLRRSKTHNKSKPGH
jgi:hypothetical protein